MHIIAFLIVYRTQVSGWIIFRCRFRLVLVDSTSPQIVQVVLQSCTASVVGQTLRTFKSLVTLRALVEHLLFIGASQI